MLTRLQNCLRSGIGKLLGVGGVGQNGVGKRQAVNAAVFLHLLQNTGADSLQRLCAVCFHPPGQVFKEHGGVHLRPLGIIEHIHIIALARAKLRQGQLSLLVRFRRSYIYTVLWIQFLEAGSRKLDFIRTCTCKERDNRRVFKRFAVRQLFIEARDFYITVPRKKAGFCFHDRAVIVDGRARVVCPAQNRRQRTGIKIRAQQILAAD